MTARDEMSSEIKVLIMTHERVGLMLAGSSVLAGALLSQLVSPWFWLLAAGTGLNLVLSGLTNRCAVKSLLIRMGFPGERDVGRAEGIVSGVKEPAANRVARLSHMGDRHRAAVN